MRSIVLLLLGVPILIVILIALFSHQANVVRSIGVLADHRGRILFHVAGALIHLLFLLAVISIVVHLLTGLLTA